MERAPSADARTSPLVLLRGAGGGLLMGLASLVPGISGGTLLLAAGVYPGFIGALAELTALRLRLRPIARLAAVGLPAAAAMVLLAGTAVGLLEARRWVLHSLFLGLCLGGVPRLWRGLRPARWGAAIGAALGCGLALAIAAAGPVQSADAGGYALSFLAGALAASAAILPGPGGGDLLRWMGHYEPALGSIDQLVRGAVGRGGSGPDLALALDALRAVAPLGIGAAAGVVGVSQLLRWLLARFEKPTLGALTGLLLGAAVGLWPFQQPTPPEPGDVVRGRLVTARNAESFDPASWPLARFDPSPVQVGASLGLVGAGLAATLALGRLGRDGSQPGARDRDA